MEVVGHESALSFFREQVERAMEHQKVSTSAFTEYYLVNLLAGCVRGDMPPPAPGFDDTPLALLYVRAAQASRAERARLLRLLGDTALFVSGVFPDSIGGRLVDLAYYRAMGGGAYARLSQEKAGAAGPDVFAELSFRFTQFADVLAEVAEGARLASNASIVKLYERWLQTGSPRAAQRLAEKGITPIAPEGGPVQ
jgi:hypothetical protein